jgi:hypothetical protein
MTPPVLVFVFRILLRFDAGPRLRFEPAYRAGRRGFVAVERVNGGGGSGASGRTAATNRRSRAKQSSSVGSR